MSSLLRQYIRESLRIFFESKEDDQELLAEQDETTGEKSEENTIAGGGLGGVTTPLGTGPTYPDEPKKKKRLKKKSDINTRAFGGGEYEGQDEP